MSGSASPPEELGPYRYRPRRLRVAGWSAAVLVVLASLALSAALTGPVSAGGAPVGLADRVALVGLGLVGAAVFAVLTRPSVVADAHGVRVRNVFGERWLPWEVVRAVRYERGASWAVLELADDDVLGVLAVQAVDKERAVEAARALRVRHAAAQRRPRSRP